MSRAGPPCALVNRRRANGQSTMTAKHSATVLVCSALLAAVPVFRAEAARFHEYTAKYKTVPSSANRVAATCLGGPGTERLAGVAFPKPVSVREMQEQIGVPRVEEAVEAVDDFDMDF